MADTWTETWTDTWTETWTEAPSRRSSPWARAEGLRSPSLEPNFGGIVPEALSPVGFRSFWPGT